MTGAPPALSVVIPCYNEAESLPEPHARPAALAPVDQVVPAFGAGPGVVRDLIGRHPRRGADLLWQAIERHIDRRGRDARRATQGALRL